MTKISIDFDQQVYLPGQIITGIAICNSDKPVKAKHLVCRINGVAKAAAAYGEEVYVKFAVTVWEATADNDIVFRQGTNLFQFAYSLPRNCPPSFEGKHGHVRYTVYVELGKSACSQGFVIAEKQVRVAHFHDLADCPIANRGLTREASKRSVRMEVSIPKQGFIPDEVIPITLKIHNQSMGSVKFIRVRLHQKSSYRSNCHCKELNKDVKCLEESRITVNLTAGQRKEMKVYLTVPTNANSTFECRMIQGAYSVSVALRDSAIIGGKLKLELPLIVGTIGTIQSDEEFDEELLRALVESVETSGSLEAPEVPQHLYDEPPGDQETPILHYPSLEPSAPEADW